MSNQKEMLDNVMASWQAGDVDSWLGSFTPDAKFFVPGTTSVSGDHAAASFRVIAPRLMRAQGNASGLWAIDTFISANGAVVLADQKVDRDGETHHYHAMLLHELGPNSADQFAFWWLMVHEYDAFERAWA